MVNLNRRTILVFIVALMGLFGARGAYAFTDPQDVFAINYFSQYIIFPPPSGWRLGADPCFDRWKGVKCVDSKITAIILNGANLGGWLPPALDMFTSIRTIDLSNNHIVGSIPNRLPRTLKRLILSNNLLTGTIPISPSDLPLLSTMALNNNMLIGELPDAFKSLTGLTELDLSSNKFKGQLPLSMGSLSLLKTLHLENNHLSGTIDILEDLPLTDVNIENNSFSGIITEKMLTIPRFRKGGNFFSNAIPSSPSANPPSSPANAPYSHAQAPYSPAQAPSPRAHAPSRPQSLHHIPHRIHPSHQQIIRQSHSFPRYIRCVATGIVLVVAVIIIVALVLKCRSKKVKKEELPVVQEANRDEDKRWKWARKKADLTSPNIDSQVMSDQLEEIQIEHTIDMKRAGLMPLLDEKIIVKPITPAKIQYFETGQDLMRQESFSPLSEIVCVEPTSPPETIQLETAQNIDPEYVVSSFTVASLQQYTNSFAEENLISKAKLGKVFLAQLPDGKCLTVTNLCRDIAKVQAEKFINLVSRISKLRHPNILELVGYCAQFDQRLLVYNYFSQKTLHDMLHNRDGCDKPLSWSARVNVALGAAKALEYLHEQCQLPHHNFDSAKILLDDGLGLRISECGLAALMQLNNTGEVPETNGTDKSDVYSFGIVLLELLTGRKPSDPIFGGWRPQLESDLVATGERSYDINLICQMVDPSMHEEHPKAAFSMFAVIIIGCLQIEPESRPSMSKVVQDLRDIVGKEKSLQPSTHMYTI